MTKRKSFEEGALSSASDSPASSKKVRIDDILVETSVLNDQSAVNGTQVGNAEARSERHHGTKRSEEDDGRSRVNGNEVEEPEADDEHDLPSIPLRQHAPAEGYGDLYLDTINRSVLDFDFEKLCSVSLSNINVYACLVCGKYFQGRGPKSHAYFHALEVGHHVFINMETKRVYVLPEGYEVHNKSLQDIKYVVDPKFSEAEVRQLDKDAHESTDLLNQRYRPGFIGMNNIKANDYLNVVAQALAHVAPIRNFFLLHFLPPATTPQLPLRFSALVRKLWNPRAFRNHVSPHELLQEIALRSSKRFTLTHQSDPSDFLSWFLNTLHLELGGSRSKLRSSVIQKTFQGKLRIESQAITAKSDTTGDRLRFEESSTINQTITPYLMLTLDLPPRPLFRDSIEARNIIPQISLTSLLHKYSGLHTSEKQDRRVRHRLMHPLPPYLIFHIQRFSANKFVSERNPTIVTFPSPRGLDMSPYVEPNPDIYPAGEPLSYELVANIILDATDAQGSSEDSNAADAARKAVGGEGEMGVQWKVQLRDHAAAYREGHGIETGRSLPEWLEIQDLIVKRTEAETLFTREGYLMVWERSRTRSREKKKAQPKPAHG